MSAKASTLPSQKKDAVMHRVLRGVVVSDAMQKSVVVEVKRFQAHPLYGKRMTKSATYIAHDEKDEYHVGDKVEIRACRPISKRKRWFVIRKIGS